MYVHLFKAVCHDVGWSIEWILHPPFLGLRATGAIMQTLVLAFFAISLESFPCTDGESEMMERIKHIMNLLFMWQYIFRAYSTNCVTYTHRHTFTKACLSFMIQLTVVRWTQVQSPA